jgi:predicted enzyme related to lactoylglutathione lyase
MKLTTSTLSVIATLIAVLLCNRPVPGALPSEGEKTMQVHYLEIVTPDLDETCASLEKLHGVTFSEPVPELGNARTATLKGGGRIGVRIPMRPTEDPVVRPYLLVEDIQAATKAAAEAGAEIAIPPMELPGQGMFAIYLQGGIDYGLWQN